MLIPGELDLQTRSYSSNTTARPRAGEQRTDWPTKWEDWETVPSATWTSSDTWSPDHIQAFCLTTPWGYPSLIKRCLFQFLTPSRSAQLGMVASCRGTAPEVRGHIYVCAAHTLNSLRHAQCVTSLPLVFICSFWATNCIPTESDLGGSRKNKCVRASSCRTVRMCTCEHVQV